MRNNWKVIAVSAFVIAAAAVLRLYGLRWGLPGDLHQASYHPDEFFIVGTAMMVYVGQAVIPRFYNYPSLFIYITTFAVALIVGSGVDPTTTNVYLAARVVTVVTGTLAVGVTLWAGWILYGGPGAFIAALILAVMPIHVQHSHFATVDVPSTLFVAAALGFAGCVLKRGLWRDYLLAGIMAGLAAGTKYNAGLVILAVVAAHFLRDGLRWRAMRDPRIWAAVGCTLAAFLVSTPGVLLRFSDFWYGFSYELKHSSTGHGLVFVGTGNGFIYTFISSMWYGMGPYVSILFLVSAVWAVVKRDKPALMLLAFIIPYYVLISVSQVRFARYIIPVLPAVVLLTGWFADYWYRQFSGRFRAKIMVYWAFLFFVLLTLNYTLALNSLFSNPDPRERAAEWINANIPHGDSIGLVKTPWFYSPPLSPAFAFGSTEQREESVNSIPYDVTLFYKCEEPGCWTKNPPRWVVVSDYEVGDAIRLDGNRSIPKDAREQVDRIMVDVNLIRDGYIVRKKISGSLKCCDNHFGHVEDLPHDMRYTSPTITIYERKK